MIWNISQTNHKQIKNTHVIYLKSPTRQKTVQHKNFQFTTFEHSLVLSMSHIFINLHTQQKHPKVKQVWRKICWCKFNFYLTKWEEKKKQHFDDERSETCMHCTRNAKKTIFLILWVNYYELLMWLWCS